MLLFQLLGTFALAATAFAQTFTIGSPVSGGKLTIGGSFTVEVDQAASQGPFQSVSVVISLQHCGNTPCATDDNNQLLGEVLFAGSYSPRRHEASKPPYQNFTVNLASGSQPGPAVLHATQLYLGGAGPAANIATTNVSVTIGSAQAAKRSSRIIRI